MPRMANHAPRCEFDTIPARPAVGWIRELAAIFLVAAVLRGYVISQTPVIARDGMLYVGIARMINHGMWLELVGDWFLFNPYPALIAWLARCGLSFDFSGQLISGVASSLAVIPLYLWCRRAFDVRVAQLAALTYALHPVMLRYSGQVLREGLYWCLMLWGVQSFWMAARQRGWWRYVLAGLVTTAATLTRMEGAVVFILGALWSLTLTPVQESRSVDSGDSLPTAMPPVAGWLPRCRNLVHVALAWAMFPVTIIVLNMIFIPTGHGWHGCGRWVYLAARLARGTEVATETPQAAHRMRYFVADERARVARQRPRIEDVRELAKSLPAWNPLGEADPGQLRLQRFLILADDQRSFLFLGRFLNECWDGLLFPCVLCCLYGLWAGRKTHWSPRRDWPLAALAAILSGMLMFHLSTEYILESRYMFCLIPFVFPWSGIGAREMYRRLSTWFEVRPARVAWRPSAAALCGLLMVLAVAKLYMGLDDRSKLVQKELGYRLRGTSTQRLKIAGPESLKRVAHYAEADYFIIPRGDAAEARQWLNVQPVDFVLLTLDDQAEIAPGQAPLSEDTGRYHAWQTTELNLGPIQVYSVNWKLRLLGS